MALHLDDENEKGGGPPDVAEQKYIPWLTPSALIIIAPICWFVFPMFVNQFNSELAESVKIFISGVSFVAVIFILYLFKEPLEKSLEVELKPFNAFSVFAIVFFFFLAGSIQYSSEQNSKPQIQQTKQGGWEESFEFNRTDQHWFPDRKLEIGDRVTYTVEYSKIFHIQGTKDPEELVPGTYHRIIEKRGTPMFSSASNKIAKITVKKGG